MSEAILLMLDRSSLLSSIFPLDSAIRPDARLRRSRSRSVDSDPPAEGACHRWDTR
jgi:hypothetical protein